MSGYNKEWYDKYRDHLEEENVRRRHDDMFSLFAGFFNSHLRTLPYNIRKAENIYDARDMRVIDLGCATQEFFKNALWLDGYFGIDKEYVENEFTSGGYGEADICVGTTGDYTKVNLSTISPFTPNGFVSLFSTEIIMNAEDKYKFYNRIFAENPSIEVGMVAGFYYEEYVEFDNIVEKTGNYNDVVFQTVEPQLFYQSDLFDEFRTYIKAPSELFGNDIVEVFKFFRRSHKVTGV